MGISVITPAATFPVTLDEAKAQCRVDGTADDAALTGYIAAAADYIERYTKRALMAQTLELSLDCFPCTVALPRSPATEITSIIYDDQDGVAQTLSTDVYRVDLASDPPRITRKVGQSWPVTYRGTSAVRVRYNAGYSTLPAAIKQAALLLISQWMDERSSLSAITRPASAGGEIPELPHAVAALLSTYRSFAI